MFFILNGKLLEHFFSMKYEGHIADKFLPTSHQRAPKTREKTSCAPLDSVRIQDLCAFVCMAKPSHPIWGQKVRRKKKVRSTNLGTPVGTQRNLLWSLHKRNFKFQRSVLGHWAFYAQCSMCVWFLCYYIMPTYLFFIFPFFFSFFLCLFIFVSCILKGKEHILAQKYISGWETVAVYSVVLWQEQKKKKKKLWDQYVWIH